MSNPILNGPRLFELSIESTLQEVSKLGAIVHSLCSCCGVKRRDADDIRLAAVEAANNVVIHSYGNRPGSKIEIVLAIGEREISIAVSDKGRPTPTITAISSKVDISDIESLPEGGMGLKIIHSIMDQVFFQKEEGKNTLTMMKNVNRS